VIGGIVGNQFGHGSGRTAATIAGTLVGAYAGSQWGRSIDEASRRRAMMAEQEAIYSGSSTRWQTESYRGEVIPEDIYYSEGRKCRRYKSVIWIDGEPQKAYGRACKIDGRWRMMS
jgi:surface antigen